MENIIAIGLVFLCVIDIKLISILLKDINKLSVTEETQRKEMLLTILLIFMQIVLFTFVSFEPEFASYSSKVSEIVKSLKTIFNL